MPINRKPWHFRPLYWALNNARALDYPNPESKIQNNSSPDNFLLASRSRWPAAEFGTGLSGFGFGPSFAPSRPKNRKAETKIEAFSSTLATDIKIETKQKQFKNVADEFVSVFYLRHKVCFCNRARKSGNVWQFEFRDKKVRRSSLWKTFVRLPGTRWSGFQELKILSLNDWILF